MVTSTRQGKTMQNTNKTSNINNLQPHALAKTVVQAIEAEIKLARYWVMTTVQNYRSWQKTAPTAPTSATMPMVSTDTQVRQLVGRLLREYRRKQKLLGEMRTGMGYWTADDVNYFRHVNHFGPAMADHFANDNTVN